MNAKAKNGDEWTGERDGEWWVYQDAQGRLYESKEVPVDRIIMNNATQTMVDGKLTIVPIFFDGPIHKRFHDFTE